MSQGDSALTCEVLMCDRPALGAGPRSGLRLCRAHLADDIERVRRLRVDTEARIGGLRESLRDLEPRRLRLAADLRELESAFDGLRAGLERWRDDLLGRLGGRHESLASKILACRHVIGYEAAIREAAKAGDHRRVYELTAQVEPTVELLRPRDGARSGLLGEAAAADLPDVCSAVRNAEFLLDTRMARLAGDFPPDAPACEFRRTLANLGGEVECLAVCANTDGVHCSTETGSLVAKDAKGSKRPVAAPCLFVSYDLNEKPHHMLVIELGSNKRLKFTCALDWSQPVADLHCDDRLQRLYVAQGDDGVTVATLWGAVLHKVNANSLEHRLGAASALDGSRDRLFVLDGRAKRLLAVDKADHSLAMDLDIGAFYTGRPCAGGLALSGSRILVADKGGRAVHNVCSITGRLIASYPTAAGPPMQRPTGVAVDSRGVVCVSDSWSQTVQLLLAADGSLVQLLGQDGQPGSDDALFDGPQGVRVLESQGRRLLYVVDWRNQAVKEFELH